MTKTGRPFTYTVDRGACAAFVGTQAMLLLPEAGATAFLAAVLVRGPLRVVLLGLLVAAVAAIIFYLLTPVWTRHQLNGEVLELRYGFDRLSVPVRNIATAQAVDDRRAQGYMPRARYQADHCRAALTFSGRGLVLLTLRAPTSLRLRGADRLVERILFNVDEREALLTALDVVTGAHPTAKPPPHAGDPGATEYPAPASPRPGSLGGSCARVAIETAELTRRYGERLAVDRLCLSIRAGEIYGFLGPNGAGKTTAIKILVGLLEPNSGTAAILGHDVQGDPLRAKASLGYVADRAMLYERLTGREFLEVIGQLRDLPRRVASDRIDELLALLDLADEAQRPCSSYSFGMKRKLALAGALVHRPAVLILDEPLNGLDPRSARRLKDLLLRLTGEGATILLSTHDLITAESVCHRVGIIDRGRLVAEGSAGELRRLTAAPDLEAVFLKLTEHTGMGTAPG